MIGVGNACRHRHSPQDDSAFTADYRRRPGLLPHGYEALHRADGRWDRTYRLWSRIIDGHPRGYRDDGHPVLSKGLFQARPIAAHPNSAPVAAGCAQFEAGWGPMAGNYVGLLNGPGSDEDLLPVTGNGVLIRYRNRPQR